MANIVDREYLEATHVLRLQSAARMAGLKFKNGDLKKGEIIDKLCASTSIGAAAVAALKRQDGTAPNMNEWLGDDEEMTPQPPQAGPSPEERNPSNIPAPILSPIAQANMALYALKTDLQPLREEDMRLGASLRQLETTTARSFRELEARGESLKERIALLEQNKPVAFHIESKGESFTPKGITHPRFPLLIQILAAGENAFLKGPASSGKTTAAKQAREVLAALFSRGDTYECKATGAVSDSYALLGYKNAAGEYQRTAFRDAVEFGHLFLWDEIDGSADDAVLVVNSLDNGFVAFPDRDIPLHPHFRLIGGGNTDGSGATMEYSGRRRMDGAFRDRFAIIDWQIDPRIEEFLSHGDRLWLLAVQAIRAYAVKNEILDVVATARATRRGPRFLAQGMSRADVLETTCKRGALIDAWADVLRLPAVISYLKG